VLHLSTNTTCTSFQDTIPTRGVGFVAEIRFPEQHTPSDLHLLAEQVVSHHHIGLSGGSASGGFHQASDNASHHVWQETEATVQETADCRSPQ